MYYLHVIMLLYRHQLGLVYQVLGQTDRAVECFSASIERESVCVPLMALRGFEVLPQGLF